MNTLLGRKYLVSADLLARLNRKENIMCIKNVDAWINMEGKRTCPFFCHSPAGSQQQNKNKLSITSRLADFTADISLPPADR